MKKIKAFSNKLNLGSGNEKRVGWINLDIDSNWNPDVLCNVEEGIPFKDNSFEKVFIKHVLEHINPKKFEFVMSEIHRVCKKNAKIIIYCPYFSCSITYKTIDHVTPITYYLFDSFKGFKVDSKKLLFFRESFGYKNKSLSKFLSILNPFFSFLPNKIPLIYERFFCWVFPVEEIKVILNVSK
jgi:SAM-dependent methyltransferase